MLRAGYDVKFATGTIAAGGTLGGAGHTAALLAALGVWSTRRIWRRLRDRHSPAA